MITGFNRLNRHESLVNKEIDPICRFCAEDDESGWHIIAECPAFWLKRREAFGSHFLDDSSNWKIKQLLHFLQFAKIAEIKI